MVDETDLFRIERASNDLIFLLKSFEEGLLKYDIIERYKFRARSSYYQTLISLINEVTILKGNTTIIAQQLLEFRRKVNSFLRLADDTNLIQCSDRDVIISLQENISFNSV